MYARITASSSPTVETEYPRASRFISLTLLWLKQGLPLVMLWRLTRGSFLLGLPDLSNFCCLPGRAGGSPNGLVADAISADATLALAGITASSTGGQVSTNGSVTSSTLNDPGLTHGPPPPAIPILSAWAYAMLAALVISAASLSAARRRTASSVRPIWPR